MENYDAEYIIVVSKLKFISKIESGEKIDTQSLTIVPASFVTKLYRSLFSRGESRETTFNFINDIVSKAFTLLLHYKSSDSCEYSKNRIDEILDSLDKTTRGLRNLIDTYHSDRMYTSRIDTLVNTMISKSACIRKEL